MPVLAWISAAAWVVIGTNVIKLFTDTRKSDS